MRVYETEHFRELVETYGIRDQVDSFNRRILPETQRFNVIQLFPSHTGYLKGRTESKGLNLRVIGRVVGVANEDVFVWFNIYERRERVYEDFSKQPQSSVEKGFSHRDLESWLQQQTSVEELLAKPAVLPDDLYPWLSKPLANALVTASDGQSLFLFESEYWVNNILVVGRNDMSSFRRTIEQIVTSAERDREFGYRDPYTILSGNTDGGGAVAFRRMDAGSILLLAPIKEQRSSEQVEIPGIPYEWKKLARRAYPAYVSLDSEMWIDVQNEARANLALSPEEEDLLGRVAGRGSESDIFPLFINGSAGSGKSTMLAYIFAGLCRAKQQSIVRGSILPGRPVFLTYSGALVDEAKKMTTRILQDNILLQDDLGFSLDPLFQNWREFLIERLPIDERRRYRDDRRVDFHQFKLAYLGGQDRLKALQSRASVSPEQAWYVIRSLIKGAAHAGQNELTPDDYAELSRQDRVVDDVAYESIYRGIYQSWYQPNLVANDLWDDQDLVAHVLRSPDTSATDDDVVALVIDEAQDFTRRELTLVAKTSIFRRYLLRQGGPVSLPIIFAGDPMQSLSPTGFRWEAINAAMHEELNAISENTQKPTLEQLSNNYRSTSSIVGFANAIQMTRERHFGLVVNRLQIAWSPTTDSVVPTKYILGSPSLTGEAFADFAKQTVIIVPCEEGGEVYFVKNDPILSMMYPDVSDSDPAGNVYSATAAKGLEFERVILYKFGESAPNSWNVSTDDGQSNLEAEYFFNKLYVAATRATKYLFVVDSNLGNEMLWTHLSADSVQSLNRNIDQAKRARLNLAPLQSPVVDDESSSRTSSVNSGYAPLIGLEEGMESVSHQSLLREENPVAAADKLREHGIATKNSQTLRQAKSFYRQLGYPDKASLCEAHALQFEGRRTQAAEEFARANEPREAFHCLWADGAWELMANQYSAVLASIELSPLQNRVIAFMSDTSDDKDKLMALTEELTDLAGENGFPRPTSEQWENIVDVVKSKLTPANEDIDQRRYGLLAELFETLHREGFVGCIDFAAELFMRANQVGSAVRIWELHNLPIPKNHANRLSAETGLPAGLKYLLAAKMYSEMLAIWRNADSPTDPSWAVFISQALEQSDDILGVIDFYNASGKFEDAARLILENQDLNRDVEQRIISTLEGLCRKANVIASTNFVEDLSGRLRNMSVKSLQAFLILETIQFRVAQGWEPLPELQRARLNATLNAVRQSWRDSTDRKRLSELVWGAAYELARDFRSAQRMYERVVDTKSESIRRQARIRWLVCAVELQQAGYPNKAREWRISYKSLPKTPVIDPLTSRKPQSDSAKSSGERGALSWRLVGEGRRMIITVADDESMDTVLLEIDSMAVVNKNGNVTTELISVSELHIQIGKWTATVDRMENSITHTDPFGTSVTEVCAFSMPPNSQKSKTMTVKELRDELGMGSGEFDRFCRRHGVRVRGAGSRLTDDEVERLRKAHAKYIADGNKSD